MTEAPSLDGLLREMVDRRASDLHLTVGGCPRLRVDGQIRDGSRSAPLSASETIAVARELLGPDRWERFEEEREIDLSFGRSGLARFRANVFHQRGHVALAIRHIPREIRGFEELGLPSVARSLAERPRGLVLVTGPTGSGKSTTLATMVDEINRVRRAHIVTVEDPVEYLHDHNRSIVNQREVGTDTLSFAGALKHIVRQDPDVILVGEMRDLETIRAALTVAETGHLALATLHTNSAAESVRRIVDVFPPHQQRQVRRQLAAVLEGVIAQALLPRASGPGRVLATEVLVATPAVRALVREGKGHQLHSTMQAGRKHGMHTLNDSLFRLYTAGDATLESCMAVSGDPKGLCRRVEEPEGSVR